MTDPDGAIAHPGRLTLGEAEAVGLPPLWAQVAQYPDCQQLQLRLPTGLASGGTDIVVTTGDGRVVLDRPLSALLQAGGSVLLDTLPWPPGALLLQIAHADGGVLRLPLHKAADDDRPVLPASAAQADDGADLRWRDAARARLQQTLSRRLDCEPQGRGLRARYREQGCELVFDVEPGRDGRPMRVEVPTSAAWTAQTGLPADRRAEVLAFVAERLASLGGAPCEVEIGDEAIGFAWR